VVCMRFGLVLGHGGALPMMMLPIKLGLGGRLGDGRQQFSWIHVQDLLRAIAFLWKRHLAERSEHVNSPSSSVYVYNFTAPEPVTQEQFSKTAAEVIHRPCFMPTPAWPMRFVLGRQADLLLEGQRVLPAKLQAEGFEYKFPTLLAALQNLH
jgi:uncharacterized protein (TIGR01777 family)